MSANTTNPQDWREAMERFESLADLPAEEREGELNKLRDSNAALHARVARLLEGDSQGGEGGAEIAGVKLHRLRAPFRSSDFIGCEDEA